MVRSALCVLMSLFAFLGNRASAQSQPSRAADFITQKIPQSVVAQDVKANEKACPATSLRLPLGFEVNRGQAAGDADFLAHGPGYSAQLRNGSLLLNVGRIDNPADTFKTGQAEVQIALSGANRKATAVGEEKLPGISNYLFGSDPARWITGVEHYAKVRYRNVYPGIDLLFHGNQSRVEQDFIVHPGANPGRIRLDFQGVQRTELNADGMLLLHTGDAAMRMQSLRAYQRVRGQEVEVPVHYELQNGRASFRLGSYDRRRELIIDPVLVFATFFGGGTSPNGVYQLVSGMAVDASGIYVAGSTSSTSFPVTPGVVEPNPQSSFVSKLDPTGQSLIFSTYMAGFDGGLIGTLAVDSSENIYIAGPAAPGLPFPPGSKPFQGTIHGIQNVAVLKLNGTGTAVLAATYLGGSGADDFGSLAVDSSQNIYVTGTTSSNDFPVQNALQTTLGSSSNAFVTKLNPGLSGLVYSTYLGGSSAVSVFPSPEVNIAVDSSGDAYVVGGANAGFPTTSGAYQQTCPSGPTGNTCAFYAKLNPNDSALLYSTYLGSGLYNGADAVVVDGAENAYIAGMAWSSSFPVVNPIQSCSAIGGDGTSNPSGNFLSEFNSAGALVFSTCLGINLAYDGPVATPPVLALDSMGNIYFAASAQPGLPLQDPIDANEPAQVRAFVSEISSTTKLLLFSSFVAGPITFPPGETNATGEDIYAIAVDSSKNIYLGGSSTVQLQVSYNPNAYSYFPVFNPMQPYFSDYIETCNIHESCAWVDGFIMEISPSAGAAAASVPAELQFPPTGVGTTSSPLATMIYDLGTDALTVSNVVASSEFAVQSNNCTTVPASGGSCAISVTFTPTAMGTQNGTLIIADSSPGSPHKVTLTGQGSTASLTPSPTQLTFGNQLVGTTSKPQTVTLTAGALAIQNFRVQVSGNFAETNNCGTSLAAFGSCQVQVAFTPTAPGVGTGTLTITDNAPNSPQMVPLTGTGSASGLGLDIAPGGSSSATVSPGATAKYSLVIGGAGMSGTAMLSCSGAPSGATCTVPTNETVSATTAADFTISVTTTAPSAGALLPANSRTLPWMWAVALAALMMVPGNQSRRRSLRRYVALLPWLLLLVSSCGGGGGSSRGGNSGGTPADTYTLTVTATAINVKESIPLTLKVQ
jgi:hypothetical protein